MRVGRAKNWVRPSLRRRIRALLWSQPGGLLVETTLTLTVFGVVGTAVLSGVQTGHIAKRQFDIQSRAENTIRNQVEYVFDQPYVEPGQSYLTVTPPDGFSVAADALTYISTSTDIETVRITVTHEGQPLKVFETVRANR